MPSIPHFLASQRGVARCTAVSGINGSAAFGLIAVSRHVAMDDAVRVALADRAGPIPALAGVYTEHDIGGQCADPSADDPDVVTFINCLTVEPRRADIAYARWKRVNDYMAAKPGYLAHILYRRACPDASFAFVNVVRWRCAESLRTAQDEGFWQLTSDLPFLPHPSLCRPVDALIQAATG